MPPTPQPLTAEQSARLVQALRSMDRLQQYTDEQGGTEVAWYHVRDEIEDILGVPRGTLSDPPAPQWTPDGPGEQGPWRPNWAVAPGETLQEWMNENNMGQDELSELTGIHPDDLSHVLRGSAAISEDIAGRLERRTGIRAQFWLNLQRGYEEALEWKRARVR